MRWALVCLAFGVPACLNPVPDEFPSSAPVTVERESCDKNPYLVGCEAPEADPVDPSLDPGVSPPSNEPGDSEDPPPDEGPEPDAGAPLDAGPAPADADVGP